jgi:protein-S-isoprenylcysteine O-methyltransferase Ste14
MLKLKIPPPVYLLLITGAMWLLDHFFPIINLISAPWNKLGFLPIIFALFMDGMSLIQFFREHTTINPIHPENTKTLVTTGTYRYTRNPMYAGLLFLLIGWTILLGSLSPVFMLPVFIWIITIEQIIPEEKVLEQKFGEKYRVYKNSVNRWI